MIFKSDYQDDKKFKIKNLATFVGDYKLTIYCTVPAFDAAEKTSF